MSELWTHGRWIVKPGREEEFVRAWRELADWTLAEVEGSRGGKLVRDLEHPNRFYSFGPWESEEAISRWRKLPGWAERVARIQVLLEDFEPITGEVVDEVGKLA